MTNGIPCAWAGCQLVLTGAKHGCLEAELDLKMYTCSLPYMQSCTNSHRCLLVLHGTAQLLLSQWSHQPGSPPQLGRLSLSGRADVLCCTSSSIPGPRNVQCHSPGVDVLPGVKEWFLFIQSTLHLSKEFIQAKVCWCWNLVRLGFLKCLI